MVKRTCENCMHYEKVRDLPLCFRQRLPAIIENCVMCSDHVWKEGSGIDPQVGDKFRDILTVVEVDGPYIGLKTSFGMYIWCGEKTIESLEPVEETE